VSEFVLAIDQGTTGTTTLLVEPQGEVRARGYAPLPQHFPRPGWVEHDGREIWDTVGVAVDQALRESGARPDAIKAIGITNQRETTLLWDRATSAPVAPAIVWQDRRTAERCAALKRSGAEAAIRRRTGVVCDPYFSATKLEWLLRHVPGARAAAGRGALAFGTVDSWLVWMLTGGRRHATDPTNASRTMLFDITHRRWDDALLERFGIPRHVLPEVAPSAGVLGRTRDAGPLPDGIPVAGIAGDQQAALFGQGCVRPGQSKNTYGTGCFLLLNTGSRPVPSRAGLLTTIACGPKGEPAYALEGSVFIAGAAIQWLRDGLGIIADAADSEPLAQSVEDTGGVVLVPAFVGLGAPRWRADARGALVGLTRGTTRAHVARAALESMAFQTRDVVEAMQTDAGRGGPRGTRLRELRVDGGAAANDLLLQFQADLLGIPVRRPRVLETTALGAALLAGLATGVWAGQHELDAARRIERTFEPERSAAWRRAEMARWDAAVKAVLAMADAVRRRKR
jgi:glycerol kinase